MRRWIETIDTVAMRRLYYLAVSTIYLITASALLLRPAHAATTDTKAGPKRGIAVLASSIGSDYTPEGLAEFVQQGKFAPVVIDWAWITFHWDKTDFTAVNRFSDLMAAKKVPVAAMYRPRFLSNPTVPTQVNQSGERDVDHAEICYSDASARKWGVSWGEKILEKCPSFKEIIIYNPSNNCHCSKCTAASKSSSYSAVKGFLSEARSAWRARQAGVKLGVVYMPVPEFWKAGLAVVDVAHPFLCIREDADPAKEVADMQKVRAIVKGKMGSCLGKITWEEGARVSTDKLKTVDALAQDRGISYFFWTFDTLFTSSLYDLKAVADALGMGTAVVEAVGKMQIEDPVASEPVSASGMAPAPTDAQATKQYTPEQVQSTSVETFLERMQNPEEGYDRFAAMNALTSKAREADASTRSSIFSVVIKAMKDKSRSDYQRFQCCYVISGSGYEQGVPDLIEILQKDGSETLRSVAAEALAGFPGNKAAKDALLKASLEEKSEMVQEVLKRRLGQAPPPTSSGPALTPDWAPAAAATKKELAPSGPPKPPPGPAKPVAKPLPWPFPGDYKAQNIWNNYQQATDIYIHCGLDFIHPAGTPVTAVGPGHVSAMWSNGEHTHDFFIVTPKKGGNRGWSYTHMDPSTFTFKEGDSIKQGQRLGSLVEFKVNGERGADHLHLNYVEFTKEPQGLVKIHPLLDPLYFFDWKDTVAPSFLPLRFVSEGAKADDAGVVTVKGKVDILAAIADTAYPGHKGNLGVPVVMLSISDGTHTTQKLVLDHRGDPGDDKQTRPLYLSDEEKKAFVKLDAFPRYQFLLVTRTDGDGKISPDDATECWDTTALDSTGRPLWPDGKYSVNVYAWDISGNRGVVGATVQVRNGVAY